MLNLATKNILFNGKEAMDWDVTGCLIFFMGLESVLYFVLNLLVEYLSTIPSVNEWLGFITNLPKTPMPLDTDVINEQNRLKQALIADGKEDESMRDFDFTQCKDPIILTGLRKVYNTNGMISRMMSGCKVRPERCVTAVQDLWFSIPRGQIFGFLGVNGAGKTSTMSMLCGKFPASQGRAYINQIPISNQIACRRMIGYCPR